MKNNTVKKVSFSKRCLISCDLDGTLLNNKGEISTFSKKVIKKLNDLGHIFSINTARPYNASNQFYHELELETPIVTHNGAFMFCPNRKDFPLTNWCISHELVNVLFKDKKVQEYSYDAVIDAEERTYAFAKTELSPAKIRSIINEFGIFTSKRIIKLNGNISKFKDTAFAIIFTPKNDECTMDLVNAIKTAVPTLVTRLWKVEKVGTVVKVSSTYCSKAVGTALIASYYGIPVNRVYAFGDGLDDAEMLKFAANGYAMKNGSNEAQMLANFVTKETNDKDGVARTLNRIFKLGFKEK